MTDEPPTDEASSSGEVAVAETLAAASKPDATHATAPPVRSGRRSIVPVGTQIGRYVLAERIGAGGMGNVYRAHDPKLDREIAIKLVAATDIAAAQQYLEREAQAMAKLSHPNVATVHDIGTWNDQLFIAMELCTGGSLATWLAERQPWRIVVERFLAAGRGLAAAHRIGLVHRDFKPDNVLVAADGTVKVSDFGLVRSSAGAVTASGAIEGTPAYMAPEQLAGGEVDERADQFAYAVSVWEGVCGGRPFQPDVGTRDVIEGMLRAIRSRRLMRSTTADVPARVLRILERALAPDPGERWPSVEVLVDELARAARPSRMRWVALGVAGVAAVAAITAAAVTAMAPTPDVPEKQATIAKALAPIFIAGGDLARDLGMTDPYKPDAEVMTLAVQAFDAALRATNDNELRPRLAHALMHSDRCAEAVMQLDSYLRNGGTGATTDHIGVIVIVDGKRRTEKIDRQMLIRARQDCSELRNLPTSPEDLDQLAMSYWRTGDYDQAIKALGRAYSLSGDPNFIKEMADIRRDEQWCDEAKQLYERYIALETRASQAWLDQVRHTAETCGEN